MRIERIRKKRRRRKILAGFILLLLAAIIAAPIVIFTAFRLEKVNVSVKGELPYSDTEIVKASGASLGDNVLLFDLEACGKNVCAALPYAAKAAVTRKLPSSINIEVTAAKEEYALYSREGNEYLLMDGNFKILGNAEAKPETVILVITPPPVSTQPGTVLSFAQKTEGDEAAPDDTMKVLRELAGAFKTEKLGKVNEIDVSSITDIRATYDSRIMMKFGSASGIAGKANLAASAIKEEDARNDTQLGTIDLSISKIAYFKPDYFDEKQADAENTDETGEGENEDEELTDEQGNESAAEEENGENSDNAPREYYADDNTSADNIE